MRRKLLTIMIMLMIIALLPVSADAATKGKGPVLHIRFDEGGGPTAYDDGWTDTDSDGIKDSGESWNNNDGTLTPGDATGSNDTAGEMWSTAGKFGSSGELDGTNDYVDCGDPVNGSLDFGTGSLTMAVWIKIDTITENWMIVMQKGRSGTYPLLGMSIRSSGRFAINIEDNASHMVDASDDGVLVNDENWHHVVGVFDRTNDTLIRYVDGVQTGTQDSISSVTGTTDSSDSLIIGAMLDTSGNPTLRFFDGQIDDVRIYNYARTAAQIMIDYNASAAARLGSGTDSNEGNPPVLYLPFDENTGTTVYDRSGNDNNGSFVSVPSWTAGKHGLALDLDGTDDEVTLADDTTLQFGTGNYSFSLWLNIDQLNGTSDGIFEKGGWNDGTAGFRLSLANAKDFSITTGDGTNRVHTTALNGATYGHWFHLAIVVDRTNDAVKFYKDGVELTTSNSDISSVTGSTSSSEGMHIGWGANLETNNFFNGKIDEFEIYNYARTQAQIAYDYNKGAPVAHYRFDEGTGAIAHNSISSAHSGVAPVAWWRFDEGTGTACADSSGNSLSATANAATWSSSSKIGPYGLNNTYATVADNSLLEGMSSLTITAWVYPTVLAGTDRQIVDKGSWTNADMSYRLMYQTDWGSGEGYPNGYWNFHIKTSVGTYNANGPNGVSANRDNMWHFIAGVYDGSTIKVYDNGVLLASASASGTINTNAYSVILWRAANGIADDVRVYDYARTQEQIYNDYKSTHGTLVGDTKFIDGKIGKALDFDGTGDYVYCGNDASLDFSDGVTVSAWVNPDSLGGADVIAGRGWYNDPSGRRWWLMYDGEEGASNFVFGVITDGHEAVFPTTPQADTWYHVVGTYDKSNVRIYVNGVEGTPYAKTTAISSGGADFKIGCGYYNGNNYFWNGLIDDLRIYNYARTQAQVKQDYAVSASRHGAKRTGVKDPWDGAMPVGHWKMDENTGVLARDASEGNNDGTLTNGPTWTQGKVGPALSFDGDDDYISIGSLSSAPSTAVTLAAWVKPNSVSGVHEIIDSNGGWCSMFLSGSALHMQTGSTPTSSTKGAVTNGSWNFVACTYDGSYIRNYINGVEVGNTAASDGSIQGNNWNISRAGNTFDGLIDDVRVYNYAFTQAQVSWLYNRGAPVGRWRLDEATSGAVSTATGAIKDDSVHSNDGTAAATTFSYAAGKFGGALSLDGNDYVEIAHDAAFDVNELTIVMWVKTPTSMGGMYGCFLSKQGAGRDYNFYARSPDSPYEKVEQFHFSAAWGGYTSVATLPAPYEPNTWHHVGVSVDATGLVKYYSDGVLVLQTQGTPATANNDYPIWIGRGDNYWKGQVDDVRIYNYARTAEQIKQDCNAGAASRLGD